MLVVEFADLEIGSAAERYRTSMAKYLPKRLRTLYRSGSPPPQLTGYAFLSSKDVRPLQAADMIAWELYQYANAILVDGLSAKPHKELKHLR
jgi:hypothetical protein